jgi:hypothetical protein
MATTSVKIQHIEDSTANIATGKRASMLSYDTTKAHHVYYLANGTTLKHLLTADSSNNLSNIMASVTLTDMGWVGLGGAKGRIVFDDATVDDVQLLDCVLSIGNASINNERVEIHTSAVSGKVQNYSWSTTDANSAFFRMLKSASATIGTLSETANGERLGVIDFFGVNSSSAFNSASASIIVEQNGAAGATYVPGLMLFNVASNAAAPSERLRISFSEICINEGSADVDFRVESDTLTHALFVDGGANAVGINTTDFTCPKTDAAGDWNMRLAVLGQSWIDSTGVDPVALVVDYSSADTPCTVEIRNVEGTPGNKNICKLNFVGYDGSAEKTLVQLSVNRDESSGAYGRLDFTINENGSGVTMLKLTGLGNYIDQLVDSQVASGKYTAWSNNAVGGMRIMDAGGGYYCMAKYVQAAEAIDAGNAVAWRQGTNNKVEKAGTGANTASMAVGVAIAAISSDGYGWIAIAGTAWCKFNSAPTSGDVAYVSATAGVMDSANTVPAAATHDKEIGHVESNSASSSLYRVTLHFR